MKATDCGSVRIKLLKVLLIKVSTIEDIIRLTANLMIKLFILLINLGFFTLGPMISSNYSVISKEKTM